MKRNAADTYGYATIAGLVVAPVVVAIGASVGNWGSKTIQIVLFGLWSALCLFGARAIKKYANKPWSALPFWSLGFANRRSILVLYAIAVMCAAFMVLTWSAL